MQLVLDHISKSYGRNKALSEFSATLSPGIYALLGPNGSGKSTLMNIITDNLKADKGNILFSKTDAPPKPVKALGVSYREQVGYMPQYPHLYPGFSVEQFMWYMATLKELGREYKGKERKHYVEKQIDRLLTEVELSHVKTSSVGSLSGGMKQRLALAQAVMGDPAILILDEPTNGMDVNGVIWLKQYLKNLKKTGKTILICSHSLNIMEELIDRYCIIIDGKIVNDEAWNYKEVQNYCYSIELDEDKCSYNKAKQLLEEVGDIQKADDGRMNVTTKYKILPFCEILMKEEIPALDVTVEKESLEKIFIESVGING